MPVAARIHSILVGTALMLGISGFAQQPPATNPAQAQRLYEARIANCNRGDIPAPARNACVRDAGAALDRSLGGPPPETQMPSGDGRATVIAPTGSVTPREGSALVTSDDGRATIVTPADGVGVPR